MKLKALLQASTGLLCLFTAQQAFSAIALDRTRVIFDGNNAAESLEIKNENKSLPYLAQGWLENPQGEKITSPLVVLPPVQRVEPNTVSQVKIQALPGVSALPQDRESLFYFNLREIPPRSDKPNTLQIALQTRIKLFYRPAAIVPTKADIATPWQEKLVLTKENSGYRVSNPTPYFITLVDAQPSKGSKVNHFEPLMVAPKSSENLGVSAAVIGSNPVLTYINDYGGRPLLQFKCQGDTCTVVSNKVE